MSTVSLTVERLQDKINDEIGDLTLDEAIEVVQEISSFLDAVEAGLLDDRDRNENSDEESAE